MRCPREPDRSSPELRPPRERTKQSPRRAVLAMPPEAALRTLRLKGSDVSQTWTRVVRFFRVRFTTHEPVNWRFPRWRQTKYSEYLKSSHWTLFKFNIFAKRGMRCERCASTKDINLHHKTYERIGREKPEDVEVLCRMCHSDHHLQKPEERRWLYLWLKAISRNPTVRKAP